MHKRKPTASPGQKDSQRENARNVIGLFSPSETKRNIARVNAPKTLSDLADDVCAWCAKAFETTRSDKRYCSIACRKAAAYDEHNGWRARQRETLVCRQCSTPIVNAVRRDQLYCDPCRKDRHLVLNDKCRRKRVAERHAAALASLTCARCSGPIEGAVATWRKYCDHCRTIVQSEAKRRFKEKRGLVSGRSWRKC
jgi:hypothetical protein